jgi:thiol-disulfide isomerase/thioredoxin
MRAKAIALGAVATILGTSILSASAAALSEGDPAPKLSVSKWICGEPVKGFEAGTAYLVYFWATWWTPCKEAMVQVDCLHQKYKDRGLVVIGQNVKRTEGTDIEPFIKRVGPLMSYRIALDEGATNRSSGTMLQNWLFAAKTGIPAAFIIDKKGIISFIGHPDEIDDGLIEQVLAGKFDLKRRALARKEAAAKAEAWEAHNEAGRLAWQARKWEKALKEIDELEKIFPHKRAVAQCLRITVFIRKGDLQAADNLALQCSKENPGDPFLQHRVARTIATQARAKYRLPGAERDLLLEGAKNNVVLKTADLLVERAITMLKGPEPEFLHTQAQLAFLQGKREKAIQLSTEALALTEPGINDQFAEALENFKNGRLPQ